MQVTWKVENEVYLKIYFIPHPKLGEIMNPTTNVQWHTQDLFIIPPKQPEKNTPVVISKKIDIVSHDIKNIKFSEWNGTFVFHIPNKISEKHTLPDIQPWDEEEDGDDM